MSLASVLVSYFVRNGVRIDELALVLAVLAIIILMSGVIHRAARVIAFLLMIPTAYMDYFDAFLRRRRDE
ncbi:hypothetical protein BGW80DRAFT_1457003 [Lactifluus volemus]|nr:hypothetical protein BGW80DRAFT_1457003 [Lactifluus volemus]